MCPSSKLGVRHPLVVLCTHRQLFAGICFHIECSPAANSGAAATLLAVLTPSSLQCRVVNRRLHKEEHTSIKQALHDALAAHA